MTRSRLIVPVLGVLLLCAPPLARAQDDWPNRPIRILLPAGPGGTSDILLRLMTENLTKSLGQPVVVENKPGAGGTIAATMAAQSKPDGYTLMMSSVATHGIGPWMYKLPFDPEKDVTGIAHVAFSPNVLYVRKDSPFKSVRDLVAHAKGTPGKLTTPLRDRAPRCICPPSCSRRLRVSTWCTCHTTARRRRCRRC